MFLTPRDISGNHGGAFSGNVGWTLLWTCQIPSAGPLCLFLVLLEGSLAQLCGMEEPGGLPQIPGLPRVPASAISVSFPEEFLEMEKACRVAMFFL